ncbi:MAG: YbgC/FadM family acyl-CoA thioesterase [Elusimicrobiota bacterium]
MEIKIYYRDTDCGGVVYYANYLDYFEMARTEWLESRGICVKSLKEAGVQFIVKHAQIDYISPGRYGDILTIETELENISGVKMDFGYDIREKESGRQIVRGATRLVSINEKLRPCRLPAEVVEQLTLKK